MTNEIPTVSIGLAVYNGERFLEEAIDSILGQTYTDFELIISDNASTDRTEEICRRYAANDARIRYVRNKKNIGGANNENQTYALAQGKYFRLAADDDVCAPELLARCTAILDKHPEVILAHSKIMKIDARGDQLGILDADLATSDWPSRRFRDMIDMNHNCESTYGLVRSRALARTSLQQNYTDSDRTLLAELALLGKFYQIPEVLFFKRYHDQMSTQQYTDWRERMHWFGDVDSRAYAMPHWRQFIHYLQIITRTPLPFRERILCYLHMIKWLKRYHKWQSMLGDLVFSARYALHSVKPKRHAAA